MSLMKPLMALLVAATLAIPAYALAGTPSCKVKVLKGDQPAAGARLVPMAGGAGAAAQPVGSEVVTRQDGTAQVTWREGNAQVEVWAKLPEGDRKLGMCADRQTVTLRVQ
jgi:hypothetical protein